jgi:hypothetical protein
LVLLYSLGDSLFRLGIAMTTVETRALMDEAAILLKSESTRLN